MKITRHGSYRKVKTTTLLPDDAESVVTFQAEYVPDPTAVGTTYHYTVGLSRKDLSAMFDKLMDAATAFDEFEDQLTS